MSDYHHHLPGMFPDGTNYGNLQQLQQQQQHLQQLQQHQQQQMQQQHHQFHALHQHHHQQQQQQHQHHGMPPLHGHHPMQHHGDGGGYNNNNNSNFAAITHAAAAAAAAMPDDLGADTEEETGTGAGTTKARASKKRNAPTTARRKSSSNANQTNTSNKARNRTWDENYQELVKYKEKHGNCDVPYRYKGDPVLGTWVSHLRENKDASLMTEERKAALTAIGFDWHPYETRWKDGFQRLVKFKEKHGHCKVPVKYQDDKILGGWARRQRECHRIGTIPPHRMEALEKVGFVFSHRPPAGKTKKGKWNAAAKDAKGASGRTMPAYKLPHNQKIWDESYQQLVKFQSEHGHCNVPKNEPTHGALGKWVTQQRVKQSQGTLDPDRKKLLDDIGFNFDWQKTKLEQEWNRMYELLKEAQPAINGNEATVFTVPKEGPNAASVARWVQRQKENFKCRRLTKKRKALLEELNFPFPAKRHKSKKKKFNYTDGQVEDYNEEESASDSEGTDTDDDDEADTKLPALPPLPVAPQEPAETQSATTSNSVGNQLAQSMALLAHYLQVDSQEIASRLNHPLGGSSPFVQCPNCLMTGPPEVFPKTQSLPGQFSHYGKPFAAAGNMKRPINAFSRLLPLVVEIHTKQKRHNEDINKDPLAIMEKCANYLQQLVEKEESETEGYQSSAPSALEEANPYEHSLSLISELHKLLLFIEKREQEKAAACGDEAIVNSEKAENADENPAQSPKTGDNNEDDDDAEVNEVKEESSNSPSLSRKNSTGSTGSKRKKKEPEGPRSQVILQSCEAYLRRCLKGRKKRMTKAEKEAAEAAKAKALEEGGDQLDEAAKQAKEEASASPQQQHPTMMMMPTKRKRGRPPKNPPPNMQGTVPYPGMPPMYIPPGGLPQAPPQLGKNDDNNGRGKSPKRRRRL